MRALPSFSTRSRAAAWIFSIALLLASTAAFSWPRRSEAFPQGGPSVAVPAQGSLEVAFSPNGGAEQLVVKLIDSSRFELRLLGYDVTSPRVVDALIRAHKRGVDVKVVVDYGVSVTKDTYGSARRALLRLAQAGIDVRTINVYANHHDKVVCSDRDSIELGSLNYSVEADRYNSENVLVNWHNPPLVAVYLQHFARNYAQATPFVG